MGYLSTVVDHYRQWDVGVGYLENIVKNIYYEKKYFLTDF